MLTDLTTAPPQAPPEASVPPVDAALRTEHHDFLLVGYLNPTFDCHPDQDLRFLSGNEPEDVDVFCTAAAELPAFVARWADREFGEHTRPWPRLWLKPHLRSAFVEAAADWEDDGHSAGSTHFGDRLDPALAAAAIAATPAGPWRPGIDYFYGTVRVGGQTHEPDSVLGDILLALWRAGLPMEGTGHELERRAVESMIDLTIYAPEATAGGYVYVVTAPDRATRERRGDPYLATLHGEALRPAKRPGALPEPAAEFLAWVRRYHDDKGHHDCPSGAVPSDEQAAAWLAARGIDDPAPAAGHAPDGALADDVEREVGRRHDRTGKGSTVTGLANTLGRQKKAVGDAARWLKAQGRLTLRAKLYWPADE